MLTVDVTFSFIDSPTILATTDHPPGRTVSLTATIHVTGDQATFEVPVVEGPIGGYGDDLP